MSSITESTLDIAPSVKIKIFQGKSELDFCSKIALRPDRSSVPPMSAPKELIYFLADLKLS